MDKKLVGWSHPVAVVNGSESRWPSVTSDVPQGSGQYLLFQNNSENTFGQEGTELVMVAVFSAEGMLWGACAGIG